MLLVEDEEMVRRLAKRILEQHGYRVIEAADGVDALTKSEAFEGHIHLMLSDVVMPLMNGRELYEKLKNSRPDIKTLFTSGYSDDVIARHGVLNDATRFLNKPFSVESLIRKVRDVLDE